MAARGDLAAWGLSRWRRSPRRNRSRWALLGLAAARTHRTPGGREEYSHPAGKPYPVEANPWSGMEWRPAFLVSSRHLKWRMRQGLPAISEAPFSPIMIVGACVQA